tara:strand:- start:36304 stop:36711 length:408 start_codon:yes stop_codon:yes gene_type:complete
MVITSRGPWGLIAVAAGAVLVMAAGRAPGPTDAASGAAQERTAAPDFYYCTLATRPYGDTVYVSRVFGVSPDTYSVGIQNAFASYVSAHFDPDAMAGANCLGPNRDRDEMVNRRMDHIAERRRAGKQVVVTRWAY